MSTPDEITDLERMMFKTASAIPRHGHVYGRAFMKKGGFSAEAPQQSVTFPMNTGAEEEILGWAPTAEGVERLAQAFRDTGVTFTEATHALREFAMFANIAGYREPQPRRFFADAAALLRATWYVLLHPAPRQAPTYTEKSWAL